MFTLEALEAKEGDCLILHYGDAANPRRILIDGGPRGAYRQVLRKRLVELRGVHGPLQLEMVMVSHIDADHITGILDLFNELAEQREQGDEPLVDIVTLWFNSFDDILGSEGDELLARFQAAANTAAAGEALSPDSPVSQAGALILAGVGQGRRLRGLAAALGTQTNAGFEQLVMAAAAPAEVRPLDLGDGLKFTVLGPAAAQLAALRREWDAELAKMKKASREEAAAIGAAFLDESAANLSSTVVLAERGGKRMLLTGDARGDFVLDGLRNAGLLENGEIHLDLLKVPHHGSDRNVTLDFFERITADHYVISANGKYDNPDHSMLEMLREARKGQHYTVYFTNEVTQVTRFMAHGAEDGFDTVVRDRDALSLSVAL
ncbi:MAG: hypothetical protein AB7S38_14600 [Vulcanimicrobiota bacterium]